MIKYYIVDAADVNTFLPYMEQALGHPNISARYSLDNTQAILKFDENNLPPGYNGLGYTVNELREILKTSAWTEAAGPMDPKTRNRAAKEYGAAIIEDLFANMDAAVNAGQLNLGQLEATLNQYESFMGLLERGWFGLLLHKNSQQPITGNGVLSQQQINSVLANITQWESDHPRT